VAGSEQFAEDEAVCAQLTDPLDREAFANLMAHAHQEGKSAAAMIREEPSLTSRPRIRKLCIGQHKAQFIWAQVKGFVSRFGKPLEPPQPG